MQTILSTNPFIAWTWCHDAVVNALCHEGENLSQRGTLFSRSFDTQIQVKFMDAQIFLHPACWQNAIPSCQSSKKVVSV